MASLGLTFDPNSVAPSSGGGSSLHPEGTFKLEIYESEVGPTKSGTGVVARLGFRNLGDGDDDTGGADKGKTFNKYVNVQNQNETAQRIGQAELSAICAAAGYTDELTDTEQLHYLPLWAQIKHKQQMKNKVPQFWDDGRPQMELEVKFLFEGSEPTPAPVAPPAAKAAPRPAPAQTAQPAPAGGSRPWGPRK